MSSRFNGPAFAAVRYVGLILLFVHSATAQVAPAAQTAPPVRVAANVPQPAEDYTWWYTTLFILFAALAGAVFYMLKNRKADKVVKSTIKKKEKQMSDDNSWDANSVDAEKELEWFRRHKKTVGGDMKKHSKKNLADRLPKTSKVLSREKPVADEIEYSEQDFKTKLKNLKFDQLPIFKFTKLELARPFAQLSISNDDALMSAIEQTHDEFEEDEEIRDLAVRILQRFKTRNSVEALSQVALYDVSSNIRSKAVAILADFDHESVFETILLCCADPTREVRAAAARGLFRLSFDRADAWSRIFETNDEFRMRQAALAAKEADLVKRSFDRLVHQDQKIAYEAVTLLALMIRAGESAEIFKSIESHNDSNVKLALIHVVGLAHDEESLSFLYGMLEKPLSTELKEKIDGVIESFEMIPA